MSAPPASALEVRNHLHAIVGLAERIVAETNDALANELAAAICHQSRFLLSDPRAAPTDAISDRPHHETSSESEAAGPDQATAHDAEPQLASSAPTVQVVDASVLLTLADEIGSPEIVGTLVDTFLGELHERIGAILNGVAARDEEACRAAHTLKGTAATMGAVELTELAATLEHHFRSGEGEPEPVAHLLPAAGERCRTALTEVVTNMAVAG